MSMIEELSYNCKIYLGDCLTYMRTLPDNSIDAVITDPPYQYLEHKLDIPFNERAVFRQLYRILKPDGFLIFFGRGSSFYRWNYMCEKLGFIFREELIWDKRQTSSPILEISRIHETLSIYLKSGGRKVNRVYLNKFEYLRDTNDVKILIDDIARLVSKIKNIKSWDEFKHFQRNTLKQVSGAQSHAITVRKKLQPRERAGMTLNSYTRGKLLTSILTVGREHFSMAHPTQKPLKLMKYLVQLVSDPKDVILDPFGGVFSTGVAALSTGRNFIGCEILPEYYEKGKVRLTEHIHRKDNDEKGK